MKVQGPVGAIALLSLLGLLRAVPPSQAPAPSPALTERARQFLAELIRLDTSNPPGNESRVAGYLKRMADLNDIPAVLLGDDPNRPNFIARLRGSGQERPLLLMAHSDVVPVDRSQWTADPFGGEAVDGNLYGRGAQDDKCLLAAELSVLVELKQRAVPLKRDVVLLSEADEEADSSGIRWLIANAFERIDAEAALNEGGLIQDLRSGTRLVQIQTAEKIPTRVILTARGTAGHASLPRADNPVVRLARAIVRLQESEQPVGLNPTTRRYLTAIARLPDYEWLPPLLAHIENPATSSEAAHALRERDPELDAQIRASVSPTMLQAGIRINVIPNTAVAQIDVRRLPNETRAEILARFRRAINDASVEVTAAESPEMPATEPSSTTSPIYQMMEKVLMEAVGTRAVVTPFMSRGATDGAYLRQRGMAVYGVPVFVREGASRAHGNDERISLTALGSGTELLWRIVMAVATPAERGPEPAR